MNWGKSTLFICSRRPLGQVGAEAQNILVRSLSRALGAAIADCRPNALPERLELGLTPGQRFSPFFCSEPRARQPAAPDFCLLTDDRVVPDSLPMLLHVREDALEPLLDFFHDAKRGQWADEAGRFSQF